MYKWYYNYYSLTICNWYTHIRLLCIVVTTYKNNFYNQISVKYFFKTKKKCKIDNNSSSIGNDMVNNLIRIIIITFFNIGTHTSIV